MMINVLDASGAFYLVQFYLLIAEVLQNIHTTEKAVIGEGSFRNNWGLLFHKYSSCFSHLRRLVIGNLYKIAK